MFQGLIRLQVLMHDTWEDVMILPGGDIGQVASAPPEIYPRSPDDALPADAPRGQLLDSL